MFAPNAFSVPRSAMSVARCGVTGSYIIEVVDRLAFLGACLMWRWSRRTAAHPETWEGLLRAKWVTLAIEQKQYDFKEVDPYGAG